ncbi:MAG TPA: DUF192 domain-containing protein [Dehalococcoidia bacterium]|jgi:uncharacterized membrane protein (UPF0127 family)|nr:MAG: hypothetical protein DSY78_06405 [Chloroflexota bacterium]HIM63059.1 DUF192 domain-containing protein [Dehalococcoidia bacterium]HIN23158.1 DUF192 domain-containing protein [Dehalococcoidia bacterium]
MAVGLPGPIICPIPGTKSEENLGKNLERRHPARPLVKTRFLILAIAAGLVAVTAACGNTATSTPPPVIPTATLVPVPAAAATAAVTPTETTNAPPGAQRPVVQVGNLEFTVELAADLEKRTRGLSGRATLDAGTGMLFVFEKAERFRFWMKEMQFSLDIVWIGPSCKVVDVSENVPFPDPSTPLEDLPRYSPESRAKYVLELNGGEAADLGLGIGDQVEFLGEIEGEHGC